MRVAHRAIAAAGAGFAVAALAGCGSTSGSLLSAGQASQLTAALTQVSSALQRDNCQEAANELAALKSGLSNLGGINSTLVANLQQGVTTTANLASRECPTGESTETSTGSTTTTTASTTTTSTATVTTTTTATTTTSTTPSVTVTTSTNFFPATTTTTPTTPTTGGSGLDGGGAGDSGGTGAGGDQNGQ